MKITLLSLLALFASTSVFANPATSFSCIMTGTTSNSTMKMNISFSEWANTPRGGRFTSQTINLSGSEFKIRSVKSTGNTMVIQVEHGTVVTKRPMKDQSLNALGYNKVVVKTADRSTYVGVCGPATGDETN